MKKHPGVTVGLIPAAKGGSSIHGLHKGSDFYAIAMEKAAKAGCAVAHHICVSHLPRLANSGESKEAAMVGYLIENMVEAAMQRNRLKKKLSYV